MEVFNTTDEVVDAIMDCKDKEEVRAALRVVVGFGMHDSEPMTSGVRQKGLPNKITLSLLMISVQNMAKPKGGS